LPRLVCGTARQEQGRRKRNEIPRTCGESRILVASCHPERTGRAAGAGEAGLPRAQGNWPDRPVRIIVPFTPGGSTDIIARALAGELQGTFGQPFVVENRGGAGGTIGTEYVANAPADGYTLLLGHIGTLAVNPALYPQVHPSTRWNPSPPSPWPLWCRT
jgi:hypothetical protein